MGKKNKQNQEPERAHFDGHCCDCLDAMSACVHAGDPFKRAMLKDQAESTCKACTHYHTNKKR